MAMQVNLLPASKQQRLQAKRIRRMILTGIVLVLIVTVALPLVLLATTATQNLLLKSTQDSIDERLGIIRGTENIDTMLTVKDHLDSLPALYAQRLIITELLNSLPSVTPQPVRLTKLSLDSTAGSLVFTGTANSYATVEQFYQALRQAALEIDPNRINPDPETEGYFTAVTLNNVSAENTENEVLFEISAQFVPQLIDGESPNGQANPQ